MNYNLRIQLINDQNFNDNKIDEDALLDAGTSGKNFKV